MTDQKSLQFFHLPSELRFPLFFDNLLVSKLSKITLEFVYDLIKAHPECIYKILPIIFGFSCYYSFPILWFICYYSFYYSPWIYTSYSIWKIIPSFVKAHCYDILNKTLSLRNFFFSSFGQKHQKEEKKKFWFW